MIKNLYILDENGILLYSKHFKETKQDENLLIGFFTSLANFSREALGSVIKDVNLGESNKLILLPHLSENLLIAAIVNVADNVDLVSQILKNILQDFVDIYSPSFESEAIIQEDVERIITNNLRGKTIHSPFRRILLSWLIAAPMSYILILLSINITTFIYAVFNLNRLLTPEQLFTRFMPALILLSTINIIVLFLLPNLILGYLSPNWKAALINSFIFLSITITLYFFSIEPNFAYIVIGHLPLAFIFSLFFLFIGIRYSSKKFLKK
jgi:hypothetical protein